MQTNTTTAVKYDTILEKFYHWEKVKANEAFLRQPQGEEWIDYTWAEVGNQARRLAAALKAMYPEPSNIGLVSKNCAHWIIADLAIFMAGHVSVPFYPTLNAEKLNQVLTHSQCKALIVGKLDDWAMMKDGVDDAIQKISMPQYPGSADISGMTRWEDLMAKYEPMQENFHPKMEDLMTIIYTSGTTGSPKGVMYTYEIYASTMTYLQDIFDLGNPENRYFSYLPLCHIAERNIVESAGFFSGGTIYFSESLETFAKNLASTQPTHFLAVPRIWTKFQLGVLSKMPQAQLDQMLASPAAEAVKTQIQTTLGLSKAKVILTGAAPMPSTLLQWYEKLGIHIQEVYGMTENVGACTYSRKGKMKTGTVGQPYPFVEIKIVPETGEVAMKAPWIMAGYYRNPEATAEVLKAGWLHTGDSGQVDEEGYLKITGRVKDAFKTAKGEYVVPAPIEYGFATNNNIEQVCVLGRGLGQPVALVVLSEIGSILDRDDLVKSIEHTRIQTNENLLDYEKIHNVIVMKAPWTVDNGILTPTMKIKRNVLEEKYANQLEKWFDSVDKVVFE
jgi:long-subunit acyl-CoA synthetase (AMP-forming)